MELRNVITFITAAELGSFSGAAEKLGYAQSTIPMQIRQLEEELGNPLFDRVNHSISLTTYGEQFLLLARQMNNTMLEMKSLGQSPETVTGHLRIGLVESILYSDFLKIIPGFREAFPHVLLELQTASSKELADLLLENKVDLILCLADPYQDPRIRVVFSRTEPLIFTADADHPFPEGNIIPIEKLAEEHFILTESISIYHQKLEELFRTRGLKLRQAVQIKNTRGVIELLKRIGGISYLPSYTVRRNIESGRLKVIETDVPAGEVTVIAAVLKDRWQSPQLLEFIRRVREEEWL